MSGNYKTKNTMNILKMWLEKQKLRNIEQRAEDIKNSFKIVYKEGRIYLTLQGIAFKEINPESKAEEVTRELEEACLTALKYDNK